MHWLEKTSLVKGMYRLRAHPGILLVFFAFCLLIITYLISKHEDGKVITYQNQSSDFSPGRVISSNNDIYRRKDKLYTDKVKGLENKLEELNTKLVEYSAKVDLLKNRKPENKRDLDHSFQSPSKASTPPIQLSKSIAAASQLPTVTVVNNGPAAPKVNDKPTRNKRRSASRKGPQIISFPVKAGIKVVKMAVTLPSGSFVKTRLLTGVEAPEGKALPVLMQADYAFIGPNKTRVDLSGCFMIAKSSGNLSIERVEMQVTKISCVSKSGKMFERPMNGYVADGSDNSFAVIGEVSGKRSRVAAMSFLASVVEGIGKAISQAQTTSASTALGGAATSITGSQAKYIGASGASNAASAVTSWYLKHAEKLLPTIRVGSGAEVWVVMQDSVSLPNSYFKSYRQEQSDLSFLNELIQ